VEGKEPVDDGASEQHVCLGRALVFHSGPNFISELTAFLHNVLFGMRRVGFHRMRQVESVGHGFVLASGKSNETNPASVHVELSSSEA
jgi:hypothetical protein